MRDRPSDAHRRAAEVKLGRKLRPGEDVDHLNEDKTDNTPTNLDVKAHNVHSRTTQSTGRRSLRKLQRSLTMSKRREKLY